MGTFRRGLVAATAVLTLAAPAHAAHDEPLKAGAVKADLVTGYQRCLAPNDNTVQTLFAGFAACSAPTRSDPQCGLSPGGRGSLSIKAGGRGPTANVSISGSLKGLVGCDGELLCPVLTLRATTDDCALGSATGCTAIDLADIPIATAAPGCCTVSSGLCKLKTSFDAGGSFDATGTPGDKNTGVQVLGAGVTRVSGAPHPGTSFTMGVVVK